MPLDRHLVLFLTLACAVPACKKRSAENEAGEPAPAVSSAATTAAPLKLTPLPGGTVSLLEGVKPELFQVPVGPPLGIFRGKGLGPIRFGATVQTIERLMEAPCTEKTNDSCRYSAQAIDFRLKDGVLDAIHVHGDERKFSDRPDDTYGVFNGRFAEGAALGMYAQFVIESLGQPERIEKVETAGRFPTVERHHYPDLILEYDKLENGNVVLAGVILERSKMAAAPVSPAAP